MIDQIIREAMRMLMSSLHEAVDDAVIWLESTVTANTHTRLTALCPGLPGWAGTRKVKPIWILLKQETVSGSGISWVMCKSATRNSDYSTH